ncbi:MAG TPA: putative zinc-binding metallopeptidase [Steroidobacteraceae bacterium]|nr:putative zinc-binding metallopeptidase [Steroidobacteraceae bacterium]
MRFCDLKLRIERTPLARRVRRLYRELDKRQIGFRPHVWLSEEWFSPDGVPGIAVPFYLAHPRLERLERRMMRNAEGGSAESAMRILRHEAGHAIDTAYRLRRRKRWRDVFGPASLPYPDTYKARPGSRRYVQHLGEWYAQSHPCEDFAETFAVWLKPNSSWRRTYAHWPAYHKLQLVDELLEGVRGRRAPVRNREVIEPLRDNTRTLADHYRRKLKRHNIYRRTVTDHLLDRIFTDEKSAGRELRASTLLRAHRSGLVSSAMRELDAERYCVEQILRMVIDRAEKLRLWVRGTQRDALRHSRWMVVYLTRLYAQGESPTLAL